MDELMKYRAGLVADIVSELAADVHSRTCPSPQLWSKLNGVYLRDCSGFYWTVGIYSRRWYVNAKSRWQASPAPEKPLEGPRWIRDEVAIETDDDDEDTLDPTDRPDTASDDLTGIEWMARDIYADYDNGLYSSKSATELLLQGYVMQNSGVLWAVGCRSGTWYSWREGRWRREPSAPPASTLSRRKDRAAMASRVLYVLADLEQQCTPLPEPVADPWEPPKDLPETLAICSNCGAVNPASAGFCVRCGRPAEGFVDSPDKTRFYPPAQVAANTPRCQKCRKSLEGGDQFCPYCGAKISDGGPVHCGHCGAELRQGALFCARCGTPAPDHAGGGRS